MKHTTLDTMVSSHEKMKMLNWWDGEDPFQIIIETIGTQKCKLIDASIWAYELKLLADESLNGNMLSTVETELKDWLKSEKSTWEKEADIAEKTQDWDKTKIKHLRSNERRKASIATRSLWAWYGKKFPMRVNPKFITTKEWSWEHKKWIVEKNNEEIIGKLSFNIFASERKLNGIRDFIIKERKGFFNNININNALSKLKSIISIGDETAPKISLFYFGIPFIIFDGYLLRVCRRHSWLLSKSEKWTVRNKKHIQNSIFNWLSLCNNKTKVKRLKAIHSIINDCGNLYCYNSAPICKECPLSIVLKS